MEKEENLNKTNNVHPLLLMLGLNELKFKTLRLKVFLCCRFNLSYGALND